MIELLDSNVFGESSQGGGGESTKYNMSLSYYLGDVNSNGVLQKPNTTADLVLTGVKDVVEKVFGTDFKGSTRLLSVSAPDLEQVTSTYGFYDAFSGSSVESVSFPKLKRITANYAFQWSFLECSNLTSIDFSALEEISSVICFANAFKDSKLTNVSFPALKKTTAAVFNYAFNGSTLVSLSFPALEDVQTNSFDMMLNGTTNVTVHLPAALQTTVEGMTGYPNFGGTTPTILFDL